MKKESLQESDRKKRHQKTRKQNRRRQLCKGIGIGLCGALLVSSLFWMISYHVKQRDAVLQYEAMRETAKAATDMEVPEVPEDDCLEEEETDREEKPDLSLQRENTIDFETLWKTNEDIYAWIEVPGTPIDYPVLQHPSEDEYYLNHTVDRTEGLPGSIYSEKIHAKDFSAPNTVLYGHNMKNGTMFEMLDHYEEEEFFQEHPYIWIYLPDRTLVYRVFAASVFSDAYLPVYCDFESEEGFTSFLEEIRECAVCCDENISVGYGDRVLTLSTCIEGKADQRFLVEAVLVEEYEKNGI